VELIFFMTSSKILSRVIFLLSLVAAGASARSEPALPPPQPGEHIVTIGNALGERLQYFGHFETLLHLRFPTEKLVIRSMNQSGDTPAYRPRPGRESQWAFPGAEKFRPEFAMHLGKGIYPSDDEWLKLTKADTIVAFFGFNESFDGPARVQNFADELAAFVDHTLQQRYGGDHAPRLVLVSPIAFEDLSATRDLPNGVTENANLKLYTDAMRKVAAAKGVGFVDLFTPTTKWYAEEKAPLTINGAHLNEAGYRRLSTYLADALYGPGQIASHAAPELVRQMVNEKNWFWMNDYRILNGVHAYGRRHTPFGDKNYPEEIAKLREMTALRDARLWEVAQQKTTELAVDDNATRALTPVESNVTTPIKYLTKDEAIQHFTLPEGYKISLFAAESEWPDLQNPVQMTFDNRGRLWVAVLPSYPHYRPGDPKPDDKILIYEDIDGDGRADRQTVFARGLHLPIGFEITPEGVYVSQQPNLVLLKDLNGDDQADETELIMHGFDSHDTHHAISAFVADASGSIYMQEGRFLHSQVETPYGCIRTNDGGVYRFDPKSWRLERFSQYDYNNPWGISFDEWGQNFISDASSGNNFWLLPLSLKLPFGIEYPEEIRFTEHKVRPTAGTEFIYSRHFPDDVQGDFMVNNTIGFLGTKQYSMREDGAGFRGDHRTDFIKSSDPNFRPVDMEFAPDGSLYLIDWHNALIGHMQHSARDPNRDHEHGRVYRVTYPARALVNPAPVAGETIDALLSHLTVPEYRTRYRTHRELQGRSAAEVLPAVKRWVKALDQDNPDYERFLLDGLWVTWGHRQIDSALLERCLTGKSHQLRAAAVRVVRHEFRHIPNHAVLLKRAAGDPHARVRLEAMVASSWVGGSDGAAILLEALRHPLDHWMKNAAVYALVPLQEEARALLAASPGSAASHPVASSYLEQNLNFADLQKAAAVPKEIVEKLGSKNIDLWKIGREVYSRDGHCVTCHQSTGEGVAGIYPPLKTSEWVAGDSDRLIKIVLQGLMGEIVVNGQTYRGDTTPPMPGFAGMLTDQEVAGVLTYTRSFLETPGEPVAASRVKEIREQLKGRQEFYKVEELLKEHPMETPPVEPPPVETPPVETAQPVAK
jgi:mono/diheme cytochrome c family protein/glucose/arabinose dehydrogenase